MEFEMHAYCICIFVISFMMHASAIMFWLKSQIGRKMNFEFSRRNSGLDYLVLIKTCCDINPDIIKIWLILLDGYWTS